MISVKGIIEKLKKRQKLVVIIAGCWVVLACLLYFVGMDYFKSKLNDGQQYSQLNLDLPRAVANADSNWGKSQYYEQAERNKQKNADSFLGDFQLESYSSKSPFQHSFDTVAFNRSDSDMHFNSDKSPNSFDPLSFKEQEVYKKLEELDKTIASKPISVYNTQHSKKPLTERNSSEIEDADLSENPGMEDTDMITTPPADPEMSQIDGMLEKILDIQHPDRIREKVGAKSRDNKTQVFPVSTQTRSAEITLFGSAKSRSVSDSNSQSIENVFFGLPQKDSLTIETGLAKAIIERGQSVVSGATIKLKLSSQVFVAGQLLKPGQLLFGQSVLTGDRLKIEITSLKVDDNILPVRLTVYDLDGLEGIYIPESVSRESINQSSDQALQSLNIPSLDPSIGAQAASAGIQAAKTLMGKKSRVKKVTIKPGYEVFVGNIER